MKVRFVWLRKEIDRTVAMPAPKKVTDMAAWFKAARKAVAEIPEVTPATKWKIRNQHATPKLVVFELFNGEDIHSKEYDFCHVVINREASSLLR